MVWFRIGPGFENGGLLFLLVVFHQLWVNVHWAEFSALKVRVNWVYCIIRWKQPATGNTRGQWVLTKDRSTFQALFLGIWAAVGGHPMFLIWGNNLYLEPADGMFYMSMRYAWFHMSIRKKRSWTLIEKPGQIKNNNFRYCFLISRRHLYNQTMPR